MPHRTPVQSDRVPVLLWRCPLRHQERPSPCTLSLRTSGTSWPLKLCLCGRGRHHAWWSWCLPQMTRNWCVVSHGKKGLSKLSSLLLLLFLDLVFLVLSFRVLSFVVVAALYYLTAALKKIPAEYLTQIYYVWNNWQGCNTTAVDGPEWRMDFGFLTVAHGFVWYPNLLFRFLVHSQPPFASKELFCCSVGVTATVPFSTLLQL